MLVRALALAESGRRSAALEEARLAVSGGPVPGLLRIAAARLFGALDRPAEAFSLLDAAALLVRVGAFAEAEATYARMREADPASAAPLVALGRLRLWAGDGAAAAAFGADAAARDPGDAGGPLLQGAARMLAGEVRE